MKKTWFKIFMGLFVLLFAGLWIAGGVAEARSRDTRRRGHHRRHRVDVPKVVAVAGGGSHSIEIKLDGTVWAWGNNEYSQLGDGTTIDSPAPIQVNGLTDVIDIAGGGFNPYVLVNSHTIALKSDGTVWTWGDNSAGQLGNGTMTDSATPIQVNGLTDVTAVAAGSVHSIALKADGTVWTWGYNVGGVETTESCAFAFGMVSYCSTSPIQVTDLTDVIAIAGGTYHTVALKSDGTVWSTTSVELSELADVTAIAAGSEHAIALKTDGTVWAWGTNSVGQLGDGTRTSKTSPVQVSGLTDVTAIAAGGNNWYDGHSIALKTDGTVWAWGDNGFGQLGVTDTEACYISFGRAGGILTSCSSTPVQVSDLTDVTAISAGGEHSIALKTDSTVWAWGSNEFGQLGATTTTETCEAYIGPVDCSATPVPVRSKVTGAFSVSGTVSGLTGTLTLQNNGGDDLIITENGLFTFATELEDLATYDITPLTQPDGQVCKIISLNSGRINNADVTDVSVTCSDLFTNAVAVAGGGEYSMAVKTDGTVWAWGRNEDGQLGDGTTTNSVTPVQVLLQP